MSILRSRWTWVTVLVLAGVGVWLLTNFAPPTDPTVSTQTTYITEPLAADGLPDYLAAFDELSAAGVNPDKNAVIPLLQILGPKSLDWDLPRDFYARLGMEPLPDKRDYFVSFLNFHQVPPAQVSSLYEKLNTATHQPWKDQDIPEVTAWLEANAGALAGLNRFAERTQFYLPQWDPTQRAGVPDLFFVSTPYTGELVYVLQALAMRDLNNGNATAATEKALLLHKLARLWSTAPSNYEYSRALSLEEDAILLDEAIAGHPSLSAEAAKTFSNVLDKLPALESQARTLGEAERLEALEFLIDIYRYPNELQADELLTGIFEEPERRKPNVPRPNLDWDLMLGTTNEIFDDAVTAARSTDSKSLEVLNETLDQRLQALGGVPEGDWDGLLLWYAPTRARTSEAIAVQLGQLMLGPAAGLRWSRYRHASKLGMIRIALALEAYRKDHGEFPATLTDLQGEYLAELPVSAESGQSFAYFSDGATCRFGMDVPDEFGIPFDLKNNVYTARDLVIVLPWLPPDERVYPWSEPTDDGAGQ